MNPRKAVSHSLVVKVRFGGRDYDVADRPSALPCTQWWVAYLLAPVATPDDTERIVGPVPGQLTLGVALDLTLQAIAARQDSRLVSDLWIYADEEIEPQLERHRDDDDSSHCAGAVVAPC